MPQQFVLREMLPSDGPALKTLMENDIEGPDMSLRTRFLVDPYVAWVALKPNLVGVVAEAPGVDGLVGAASVSFDDLQFNGQVLPGAFLENLKVHHAYRGHGLGTQLARWRVAKARERIGEQGVIITGTTADNTASLATMKKWAAQFVGPITLAPRQPCSAPPEPAGITVRVADPRDFAEITAKANRFYADYNLYVPLSVTWLDATLRQTPQIYHYRVATDASGTIVAGMVLVERCRLMVEEFRNVPPPVLASGMIPPDATLRTMETCLWFDQLTAARYLWEYVRWEFRDAANTFLAGCDLRSTLDDVLQIGSASGLKIEIMVAVNGPSVLDTGRPTANGLRG